MSEGKRKSKYQKKIRERKALAHRLGVPDMPYPVLWEIQRQQER